MRFISLAPEMLEQDSVEVATVTLEKDADFADVASTISPIDCACKTYSLSIHLGYTQ